jgi:hypothetical protein
MSQHKPKKKLLAKIVDYTFIAISIALNNPQVAGSILAQGKSKSVRLAMCACCMLFAALITGVKGVSDFQKSKPLELHGQKIVGKVIDVRYVGNKRVPHITYEFTPVNGNPLQGEGIDWTPIRPDHSIQITYLPDDPTHNLLTEDLERREGARPVWNCFTVIFVIISALSLYGSRYYRHRPDEKTAD